MRRSSLSLVYTLLSVLALVACKATSEPAGTSGPAAAATSKLSAERAAQPAAPALQPPVIAFTPPQPWLSKRPGRNTPLQPPDMAAETWRVLVTQNSPLQIKTPLWQSLPAHTAVELEMPAGSRWRCNSSPLEVVTKADDFSYKLNAWELTRTIRCSSDGWHTWSEYKHVTNVLPDGKHEMGPPGGALLRERDANGREVQSFLLLRSDKHNRNATTGPPRIVADAPVDDD